MRAILTIDDQDGSEIIVDGSFIRITSDIGQGDGTLMVLVHPGTSSEKRYDNVLIVEVAP